jgi:crotonobetainyl-CoA:carnitine CoA-transferase CaiB-like acyl-CoA transferase
VSLGHPLRVLDLTDDLALGVARQFVGMGADVVRLEPRTSPDTPPAQALHWHLGSRVARLSEEEWDRTVRRLVPEADVVVESGPATRLRTPALRESDPSGWEGLVHVLLTPFGRTGPRSAWLADDTVASAAGGMAWLGGLPGEPPQPAPRRQAAQLAGTHAVIAAQLSLVARARTGRGQVAELSAQEVVAGTLETGAISWIHAATVPGRTGGVYGHVAHRVFATADGHVAGGWSGPDRMWTELLSWLEESGEAQDLSDPVWADPVHRWEHRDHVDAVVSDFVARRTTAEIAEEGRRRALPWAAVAQPRDLVDNPQLRDRGFLLDLTTEAGESVWDVGFAFRSPGAPSTPQLPRRTDADVIWRARDVAPILGGTAWRPPADLAPGTASLAGLRVLDLTWVLAGPYATKVMAEHGADVIKVESAHRQDPTRFSPSMRLRPGAGPDDSGYFINFNRNKRSLALNLRTPEGVELVQRLAAHADVVVENFAPGVLAKWGLDHPRLSTINPDVVLVSMAGVGATGPWRRAVTFADTLAAMSGLTHETGGDGPPQGLTFGLGDMVAANAALSATLDLLLAGRGGHVDLSQLEAMAAHLGEAALEHQLPTPPPTGLGPYVLRAPGNDRWLAVGATHADALATVLGEVDDPEAALAELSLRTPAADLAARLQAAGVPAYPVQDGRDLVEDDPQLLARSFFPSQQHPRAGAVRIEGLLHHLADTPGALSEPAPLLGEHTDEVLRELLDLTDDEITHLRDQGVLE